MFKLLIKLLLVNKDKIFEGIKIKGKIYIVDIKEYEPSEIIIQKLKCILNAQENQDAKV